MAKRGSVESSLVGLRSLVEALTSIRKGRVDLGFFAGDASRTESAAHGKRVAKYIGAGSKDGYFKQGVDFSNKRKKLGYTGAAHQRAPEGQDEPMTNPEIAAKNEFGVGVPRRSMLRMPLHLYGDRIVKEAKADATEQLKNVGRAPQAAAKRILTRLGIAGENLVQEAFDTGGFGSWAQNSPTTIALKGSDAPLIDTAQLRRAVDSRVVAA